jgi:hypothetical protein
MRVDDVWDDCVTSLSVSCHEIGVGRRKELYLAHILGHYLFVVLMHDATHSPGQN